ncbi:MAG: type VI secretion lipoprotein TssJ [Candidatus Eisenbacteria bacterium]|nr:type VI secretion lipoprotein TssJ [Candidatus Eisenbacteria bacterium]
MRTSHDRISRVGLPAIALACVLAGPALAGVPLPFLGGGGKVKVTITAAANSNNCGGDAASALKVRVFAVADEAGIRTVLNNKGLSWSKQIEAAGANVLGKPVEDFVAPGTSKTLVIARDPKAKVIVVEGNYCKKAGADWYFVHPAKKKSLKLTSGAMGFTLTTGK